MAQSEIGRLDKSTLMPDPVSFSSIFSLEGRLDSLPLRVSNEGLLRPRVARAQMTFQPVLSYSFSVRAFREHRTNMGALPTLFIFYFLPPPRAENLPTSGRLGGSFTARVGRALFHRAHSTSKRSPLTALTFSSARPSIPSPPSPSAEPRPWLVLAPSLHQGAAAKMLRQRPSCAPHRP
jgi:hypothetical protein